MPEIPCNCYHVKADHHNLGVKHGEDFITWCRYSEVGQCPCDCYTQMSNLEYLEYEDAKTHQ
jgi:hypothetical protein